MTLLRMVMLGMLVALIGCGDETEEDSDNGSDVDSNEVEGTSFGCELGSAADQTTHSCMDYVYTNLPADIFEQAKEGCSQSGGTLVDSCDTTDSVGGCRMTSTASGITTELTIWHYMGDAASETEICAELGAEYSYVAP